VSSLNNQLVIAERDEVARGIRLLLANPLISERTSADWFDLVRRRREPIRQWFDYYCGWTLIVEPRLGYARLVKIRAATDPSRPARRARSGRAPFDRRRYVLLCFVAAELLTVPVTTIGLLADGVSRASGAEPVVSTFDSASRAERMAFVDVIRMLESFGVLEVVDGSTENFVESATAKVLYRIDSTLLLRLLAAPVGPSQLGIPPDEVPLRLDELLAMTTREQRYGAVAGDGPGPAPASDVQRNLWLRHSIFRRLTDDPVLYLDDLSIEERAYLASPTGRQLLRRAAEQGGFVLEERTEGMLFIDTEYIATDSRFPDDASTAKVAALLLLDGMDRPCTTGQLQVAATALLAKFPRWAKSYREDDGPAQLVSDALAVLRGFGLVSETGGLVQPLPAAARYAAVDPRSTESAAQEPAP
jgi:uncharacterized protein (TIGR02678 family)